MSSCLELYDGLCMRHSCSAKFVSQTSLAACRPGVSFGCLDNSTIWVSGCRGIFNCGGANDDDFRCGYPPGAASYNCSCDTDCARISVAADAECEVDRLDTRGPARRRRTRQGFVEWAQLVVQPSVATPLVVQIGANDHGYTSRGRNNDPVPSLIRAGWHALLYEPMPAVYRRLQARYEGNGAVRCVNAAAGASTSDGATLAFYGVDFTNATGNWGSATADARCAEGENEVAWIAEISSLTYAHVVHLHGSAFHERKALCERCSRRLGRALGANCMRDLIFSNTREVRVPRASTRDLRRDARRAMRAANLSALPLLVVDAEGSDHNVLAAFPFDAVPVWRVVFEANRIGPQSFRQAVKTLRGHGFYHVRGAQGAQSEWQHATAPINAGWSNHLAGI